MLCRLLAFIHKFSAYLRMGVVAETCHKTHMKKLVANKTRIEKICFEENNLYKDTELDFTKYIVHMNGNEPIVHVHTTYIFLQYTNYILQILEICLPESLDTTSKLVVTALTLILLMRRKLLPRDQCLRIRLPACFINPIIPSLWGGGGTLPFSSSCT